MSKSNVLFELDLIFTVYCSMFIFTFCFDFLKLEEKVNCICCMKGSVGLSELDLFSWIMLSVCDTCSKPLY